MMNQPAKVETLTLKDEMRFQETILLRYKIDYPQIYSSHYPATARINVFYKRQALVLQRYCRKQLFWAAVEQYQYAIKNNFPVIPYEADVSFSVPYASECVVSIYTDTYIFSGGAHGNTVRRSETWALRTARRLPLTFFFRSGSYKDVIFSIIEKQIEKQQKETPGIYFEDYSKNIREEFNENNFYLTPEGVVIYYQQYDIASYSSGIPQFTIPYSSGIVKRLICRPPR